MDHAEPSQSPASWGDARSKSISWYDPRVGASEGARLAGIDYLNAMIAGALPPPPIASLFGMTLVAVGPGHAEFRCDLDESAYNPIGLVHGGLVCTLLDSALGCAVHTQLPQGVGYTSIELKVNYLRPVHAHSGPLRALGAVVKPGRRVAFAEGTVEDRHGKVVATGSSSLLVFPNTDLSAAHDPS